MGSKNLLGCFFFFPVLVSFLLWLPGLVVAVSDVIKT
jgi:hypothetical protein